MGTLLAMLSPSLAQDDKRAQKTEAGQPAVWRDPSWKPLASPQAPQPKPNTPEAEAHVKRLRQLVAEVTERVRPQSTRPEVLEAFGRAVEAAEGLVRVFPNMAAGEEGTAVAKEFQALLGELGASKEGVNCSLLCARYYLRRAVDDENEKIRNGSSEWPPQEAASAPEYAKARSHLKRALDSETAPDRAAALHLLVGLTYLRERNLDAGGTELRLIPQKFPGSEYAPKALELLGDAYVSVLRYGDALHSYQALVKSYPQYANDREMARVVEKMSKSRLVDSTLPSPAGVGIMSR